MTKRELQRLQSAYTRTEEMREEARRKRDEGIKRALEEGWTTVRIAEAMGLSQGRVSQIAQNGR